MNMPKWFLAVVETAHKGAGSGDTHANFVWANNAVKALDQLRRMRGFKRDSTPNVGELTEEGARQLESIIGTSGISLFEARKRGFYGDRPDDQRTTLEVRQLADEERARREGRSSSFET